MAAIVPRRMNVTGRGPRRLGPGLGPRLLGSPATYLLWGTAGLLGGCQRTKVVQAFPETFVGVGVELALDGPEPVVKRVLPGSSAAQAGVQPGDRITAVDAVSTRGESLGNIVMRIRGAPDTQVTLSVHRAGQSLMIVLRRGGLARRGDRDYRPHAEKSKSSGSQ